MGDQEALGGAMSQGSRVSAPPSFRSTAVLHLILDKLIQVEHPLKIQPRKCSEIQNFQITDVELLRRLLIGSIFGFWILG